MQHNAIHLFTTTGVNVLTQDFLEKRIAELEAENLHLKRLLKAAQKKMSGNSEKAKERIRPN